VAVRLADALRRGALSAAANHSIDYLAVDWFELADLDLAEVRERLGVVAKSERAIEVGSSSPWEPGGISTFQYRAGQDAAVRRGRRYESYGASPLEA
jgi:hypothetical protein